MTMIKENVKYLAKYKDMLFIIKEWDIEYGSELTIFKNGNCFFDNFQDNTALCKEEAFEDWDVPLDSWVEVTEE
jgi:hypothetical protein